MKTYFLSMIFALILSSCMEYRVEKQYEEPLSGVKIEEVLSFLKLDSSCSDTMCSLFFFNTDSVEHPISWMPINDYELTRARKYFSDTSGVLILYNPGVLIYQIFRKNKNVLINNYLVCSSFYENVYIEKYDGLELLTLVNKDDDLVLPQKTYLIDEYGLAITAYGIELDLIKVDHPILRIEVKGLRNSIFKFSMTENKIDTTIFFKNNAQLAIWKFMAIEFDSISYSHW